MTTFDRDSYLDRIGLRQVGAGVEGLRILQAAHLSSIPFENIDPLLGIVPILAPPALQEKIFARRRGGYCFELNALFGMALDDFGFQSTTVLARVRNGAQAGGARTHQCFVVHMDEGDWLVDVGFGGPGAIWPIALDEDGPQSTPNAMFRIRRDETAGETVIERQQQGGWHALFGFDRVPVRPIDLEAANYLAATWGEAPFSTHLMMARHNDAGRITIFNRKIQEAGRAARVLGDAEELAEVMKHGFDVEIARTDVAAVWDKIKDAPLERQKSTENERCRTV